MHVYGFMCTACGHQTALEEKVTLAAEALLTDILAGKNLRCASCGRRPVSFRLCFDPVATAPTTAEAALQSVHGYEATPVEKDVLRFFEGSGVTPALVLRHAHRVHLQQLTYKGQVLVLGEDPPLIKAIGAASGTR
jgi:hypothetical protein